MLVLVVENMREIMSSLVFKHPYKYYLVALFIVIVLVTVSSAFMFTQTSKAQATAPKLSIQFTCANAVDYKQGSVCVHTQARAALTIQIEYCTNHYAVSKSLQGTQYADTRGNHTWTWTPQTKCRGVATAYVNERFGGQSLHVADTFTVK